MMKNILLMVPRLNIGGAETYTAEIAESLKSRGYNVYTASGGGILTKKLAQKGIHNFFLPMRFSTDLSAWMLKRIVKKYHIDLIHANSAAAGITAVKFKQRYKNIPVIFTAHGIFGGNKREYILNDCDKIICVSKFLQDEVIKKGFNPQKMITLYTGIDTQKFSDKHIDNTLREKLSIPKNAFTMALVARIKNLTNKGHLDMINIFKNHEECRNWHLIIIGKGKSLFKLKALIKKYSLEKNIHCVGHQIDVAKYVSICNAVVLPSYFETFGLALAEGLAMGKPGITYKVGGCPEVVIDGETGFVAKYKDEEDFWQKLHILATDEKLCKQMGKNAHEYVKKHFDYDYMLNILEKIYKDECKLKNNEGTNNK